MNLLHKLLLSATLVLLLNAVGLAQPVAVNSDGSLPNPNAMLDVSSSGKIGRGTLITRVTEAQRTQAGVLGGLLNGLGRLHGGPALGLLVFQTDGRAGFYYNTSTTDQPTWVMLQPAGGNNTNTPPGNQMGQTGTTGQQGVTGQQGQQGVTGSTGATGVAGATGPAGPTGIQGPTGPAGSFAPGASAGNTPFWDGSQWILNSSNIFNNNANVGIGTASPAEKLDVAGSIKFSGALKPDGNGGNQGQVLMSNGANVPPVWGSALTRNNMFFDYSTGGAITSNAFQNIPGMLRTLQLKAGDRVAIYATGGAAANGTVYTSAEVGVSVNNQDLLNGGYTKVSLDYAGSRFVPNAVWTVVGHYDVPTDGTYVFAIRTRQSSPSNGTATVGGDNSTVLQGTMVLQVLK